MEAIECLKTRRSTRSYRTDPVPREVIEDIIDCGRLAATGNNMQPWRFVVVTDAAKRAEIARIAEYGKFIKDAPVCVAVFCENVKFYLEDGSTAMENILLAAHAHGLGSCWVCADKKPYAPLLAKLLGAPDNFNLVALAAIGWAEKTANAPKKPLSEVLDWEQFQTR